MKIRRIASGGPFEAKIGYCRAVVAGNVVYVSGTCAQGDPLPRGAAAQCASALHVIEEALKKAGSNLQRVARVTYYLPDLTEFESCWPILAETFGDNPPAATVIETKLISPDYRIEIEVTAVLD